MQAHATVERAISLLEAGQAGQAIGALSAVEHTGLDYVAAAVELCQRKGRTLQAIAMLRAVAPAVHDPAETLIRLSIELVALDESEEAMCRLCEAGRLYAASGNASAFDRIIEIVELIRASGAMIGHGHLKTLHQLDTGKPDRWGTLFAQAMLAQVQKLLRGDADASTLAWVDELAQDAVVQNKDEEAVRAWMARGGRSVSRLVPMQQSANRPGVSTAFKDKRAGELCGVYGDVESVTISETPRGVHRRIALRRIGEKTAIQRNYLDAAGWPIPNTEIYCSSVKLVQMNSYGARGPEPASGSSVLCFVGASETFGEIGSAGWPERVEIPGVHPMNGGVEGYSMDRILARFEYLKAQDLDYVGFSVCAGWHNLIYNENTREYWNASLSKFLVPDRAMAFCTLATPLIEECRSRGLDEILQKGDFRFWGSLEPTRDVIARILDKLADWNDFIGEFCARNGATLLDLHSLMLPKRYEDIAKDFLDLVHPRPAAYNRIAAYVRDRLTEPVRQTLSQRGTLPNMEPARQLVAAGDHVAATRHPAREKADQYIYPLW